MPSGPIFDHFTEQGVALKAGPVFDHTTDANSILFLKGINNLTGQSTGIIAGDIAVNASGDPALAQGKLLLSETTTIDGTTPGPTNLYTVPFGTQIIVTDIIIKVEAVTGLTVVPTLGIGITGGEDDIIASQALTGISSVGDTYSLDVSAKSILAYAGDVIKVGIDTGASATTLTLSIDVIGYVPTSKLPILDKTWLSFNPSLSWTSGFGPLISKYRVVGKMLEIFYYLPITGPVSPSSTPLNIDIPVGFTVDLFGEGGDVLNFIAGQTSIYDSGVEYLTGSVGLTTGILATIGIRLHSNIVSGSHVGVQHIQHDLPITFANGDLIIAYMHLPII